MVGSLLIEFQKKLVSRIKDLRDEQSLSQQELAKFARVSRQTIYYLERGQSNPSLSLSLKIAKFLKKPVEEIFYDEPIIRAVIENIKVGDLKAIANELGINYDRIMKLCELTDEQLSEMYTEEELIKIANGLGKSFEELFLEI